MDTQAMDLTNCTYDDDNTYSEIENRIRAPSFFNKPIENPWINCAPYDFPRLKPSKKVIYKLLDYTQWKDFTWGFILYNILQPSFGISAVKSKQWQDIYSYFCTSPHQIICETHFKHIYECLQEIPFNGILELIKSLRTYSTQNNPHHLCQMFHAQNYIETIMMINDHPQIVLTSSKTDEFGKRVKEPVPSDSFKHPKDYIGIPLRKKIQASYEFSGATTTAKQETYIKHTPGSHILSHSNNISSIYNNYGMNEVLYFGSK